MPLKTQVLREKTSLSQEATCARSHIHHVMGVLEVERCNYVVICYADNPSSGDRKLAQHQGDSTAFGHFWGMAGYALAARGAMHIFRTGPETWKEIAVGQLKWPNLNPKAIMDDHTLTFQDYCSSEWAVEPFRSLTKDTTIFTIQILYRRADSMGQFIIGKKITKKQRLSYTGVYL